MDDVMNEQGVPPTEVAAAHEEAPRLRLILEPDGLLVELSRAEVVVGRHSDADLCLRLPDVSRRHCRFVSAARGWQIFDLGSTNGVYVNGRRVTESALHHGDSVRIGSYTFRVDLHAHSSAAGMDTASGPPILPAPASSPPQRLAS